MDVNALGERRGLRHADAKRIAHSAYADAKPIAHSVRESDPDADSHADPNGNANSDSDPHSVAQRVTRGTDDQSGHSDEGSDRR